MLLDPCLFPKAALRAVGASALLAAIGCGQAVVVTVNSDGTFTPSSITIERDTTVFWTGPGVELDRADSVVQIGDPALFPASDPCGLADDDLDHRFDGTDPNEFTGPARKGVSGIFVLGPHDEGLAQRLSTETCACELLPANPCTPLPITSVLDGNTYKLCPAEGGYKQILDATWTNPDVTGVTLRTNWSDVQIDNGGLIEYVWDDLDTAMDAAVANGKLFILDVRAGKHGTPDWIFDTYDGPAGPGPVPALPTFQDWGSDSSPPTNSCGYVLEIGDPTDASYRDLYVAMITALADHIAGDSRWFQALAHVKLSGANFLSSEARLPKRCWDGDGDGVLDTVIKPNGREDLCVCNTKLWADAAYTPEGLYQYYRVLGNTVYNAFFGRKSLGYQLIQAGFPRVVTPINFEGDTLVDQEGTPISADPAATTTDDIGGLEQTETILQQLREGRFTDPFGLLGDLEEGKLFVPQHSGIGRLPEDDGLAPCGQGVAVDPATQKALFPIATGIAGSSDTNCPNRWAVDQGTLYSQIMGFQTRNLSGIGTPGDIESALWNLTINSNGVFLELYEQLAWEIAHSLGSGATAAILDPDRFALVANPAPFSKNLYTWKEEMHERRRELVEPNPHLQDPFPGAHFHSFSKPLAASETYHYINPARCGLTTSPDRVGSITVNP